jgi:hypothetical protein
MYASKDLRTQAVIDLHPSLREVSRRRRDIPAKRFIVSPRQRATVSCRAGSRVDPQVALVRRRADYIGGTFTLQASFGGGILLRLLAL